MNNDSTPTRQETGTAVDAAPASPAIPAAVSSTAEDAFKNDPTATLEGVRGKDVTKATVQLPASELPAGLAVGDDVIVAPRPVAALAC